MLLPKTNVTLGYSKSNLCNTAISDFQVPYYWKYIQICQFSPCNDIPSGCGQHEMALPVVAPLQKSLGSLSLIQNQSSGRPAPGSQSKNSYCQKLLYE